MPPGTVFVDILRFTLFEQDLDVPGRNGRRRTPSYVAFILKRGKPIERVEFQAAEPIDAAVAAWRQEITRGETSSVAANELRRLVWEPLESNLPQDTQTVVVCPDGALTAIPWAALPGPRKNSVLLDQYAFASVPHGQFLLEELSEEGRDFTDRGTLLAVGDVSYNSRVDLSTSTTLQLATRSAARGEESIHWPILPGTKSELYELVTLAIAREVKKLAGSHASTHQVLSELPKARWAHFATHGFFADPKFRSALRLDEEAFEQRQFGFRRERTTVAGRNPLLLSGLVLAGANVPRPTNQFGIPQGDGGILTAEAIAGLPLRNLELAVLSACETGLGEVAGGEGVYGLQRAFHIAGAHNVIASLWKVDDQATAALMRLFYYKLWTENKPPIEALREAQLALYHYPEQIKKLSTSRGPDFSKTVQLVDRQPVEPQSKTSPTRLWAAFVLSGVGK